MSSKHGLLILLSVLVTTVLIQSSESPNVRCNCGTAASESPSGQCFIDVYMNRTQLQNMKEICSKKCTADHFYALQSQLIKDIPEGSVATGSACKSLSFVKSLIKTQNPGGTRCQCGGPVGAPYASVQSSTCYINAVPSAQNFDTFCTTQCQSHGKGYIGYIPLKALKISQPC